MEIRWQVTGIPVVFVSALEGKGRLAVMRQVVDTYEKWCCRLPTARLNRWLRKVVKIKIATIHTHIFVQHNILHFKHRLPLDAS